MKFIKIRLSKQLNKGVVEHLQQSRLVLIILLLLSISFISWPMASGSVARAESSRVVTIYYDGLTKSFATDASTVKEAIDRAGIVMGANDLSEPSADTEITSETFNINIYRARPVIVIDGDEKIKIMSPYQSPRLIAEQAGFTVYPEDRYDLDRIDDFIQEGTFGLKLTIIRAKAITFDVYGTTKLIRTQASVVSELLLEKGITPEATDIVRPDINQPIKNGMKLYIVRVGNDRVVKEEKIPFTRRVIQDTSKPVGYEKIKTPGQNGSQLVTYKITLENGVEVGRTVIDKIIVNQPVEEVAIIGADYRSSFSDNAAILAALRQCETHGNYQTNTGNGFYGAYQFMASTWNRTATRMGQTEWVGVLPNNAPAAVQDAFVLNNARASKGGFWSQHPGCSKALGLPQFPY